MSHCEDSPRRAILPAASRSDSSAVLLLQVSLQASNRSLVRGWLQHRMPEFDIIECVITS